MLYKVVLLSYTIVVSSVLFLCVLTYLVAKIDDRQRLRRAGSEDRRYLCNN